MFQKHMFQRINPLFNPDSNWADYIADFVSIIKKFSLKMKRRVGLLKS